MHLSLSLCVCVCPQPQLQPQHVFRNVELKSTTVVGTDPTKNVKATFNGTGQPLNFKVSYKLVKQVQCTAHSNNPK